MTSASRISHGCTTTGRAARIISPPTAWLATRPCSPIRTWSPRSGPTARTWPGWCAIWRSLLTSTREGTTAYLDADLRDTGAILAQAAGTLDFSRPVAVMLIAMLHLIDDDDDEEPYAITAALMDAVPAGSYLAISHVASDIEPEKMAATRERLNRLVAQKGRRGAQALMTDDGGSHIERLAGLWRALDGCGQGRRQSARCPGPPKQVPLETGMTDTVDRA